MGRRCAIEANVDRRRMAIDFGIHMDSHRDLGNGLRTWVQCRTACSLFPVQTYSSATQEMVHAMDLLSVLLRDDRSGAYCV